MKDYDAFEAPRSIKEAIERKRRLEVDIMNIDVQLADTNRHNVAGVRMSRQEYADWARRARSSSSIKRAEHVYLKEWIKNRRRERTAEVILGRAPHSSTELLQLVRDKLRSPDPNTNQVVALLDDYLRNVV